MRTVFSRKKRFDAFPPFYRHSVPTRIARFFLTQYTKTREKIPNYHQITKLPLSIPNDRKLFQMTIKYTSIFHYKALQIYPNWDFWLENKPSGSPGFDPQGSPSVMHLRKNF
jgi:hypothetical protein